MSKIKKQSLRSTTIGNKYKLPQQYNAEKRRLERQIEKKSLPTTKEVEETSRDYSSLSPNFKFGNNNFY